MATLRLGSHPSNAAGPSRLGVGALFALLLAILAIHFDFSMMWLAHRGYLRGDARRALDLAEAFSFGPAALVIALGVVLTDRRSKWLTCKLFAYPIAAGLLANVVKLGIPRLRPRGLEQLTTGEIGFANGWETFSLTKVLPGIAQIGGISSSDWQSFPSAHTATAVGLAVGLSRLYPHAAGYFFTLALLAGLQRVFAVAHYPSDVLAGAALALATCWLLERKSIFSLAIGPGSDGAATQKNAPLSRAA